MKTKKRIEKWLADENFRRYAEKRMQEEITEVPENHTLDRKYEELDEGFECDDRYISPLWNTSPTACIWQGFAGTRTSADAASGGCSCMCSCRGITPMSSPNISTLCWTSCRTASSPCCMTNMYVG